MAVDTRDKRASAIAISSAWRSILPLPNGAIGAGDRQIVAYMYGGILADPPFIPAPGSAKYTGLAVNPGRLLSRG